MIGRTFDFLKFLFTAIILFTGLQVHNFWQHVLMSCKVDSRPQINISKSKSKNLKRNHKCQFKEPLIATWFIGSIFQLKNCLIDKIKIAFSITRVRFITSSDKQGPEKSLPGNLKKKNEKRKC